MSEKSEKSRQRVFVTNFNPRFTGVSATAAGVVKQQEMSADLTLVGSPLPGCASPVSLFRAYLLCRNAAREAPAIWHVRRNSEMLAAIIGRSILRLNIRTVFTSSAQRMHSWFPRQLIARMGAVIATSGAAAGFVPNVKAIIPHGVDVDRFRPLEKQELGWSVLGYGGLRGIAAVGRIRPEKGTDLFVEAMIKCLPSLPGTNALVIGQARPEHAAFAQGLLGTVSEAGLAGRILFIGELAPEKMPELCRSLSLLVAVPRYEGYGMTALEAMASGIPFIASKTGAFAEFGAEGAGSVLELCTSDTISGEVLRLMSDGGARAKMGALARRVAVSRFSVAREAEEIGKVYAGLLSDSSV